MHKILIIEDDPLFSKTVKEIFEPSLYQIFTSSEGTLGYRLARNGQFDLILMDIMLPGITGLRIAELLRSNNIDTPILIVSSKNTLQDIVHGYEYLIDGYVTKPCNLLELKFRVKGLLARPPRTLHSAIKVADLFVDTNKGQVIRGNRTVQLRRKEYDILIYMLKNKDSLISREQIANNLWDMESDPFRGTIDVHLSNLRKKIDHGHKLKIIQTVHGVGYRICDK